MKNVLNKIEMRINKSTKRKIFLKNKRKKQNLKENKEEQKDLKDKTINKKTSKEINKEASKKISKEASKKISKEESILKFKKNLIFFLIYVIIYLLIYMFASNFPISSDDWYWGTLQDIKQLFEMSEKINGRYLGNLSGFILTNNIGLRRIVVTAYLTLIVYFMARLIKKRSFKYTMLSFLLVFAVDIFTMRESIVWLSSFANFMPPLLLVLIYLNILKYNPKNNWFLSLGSLIVGFAGALFVEHITIYLVILSIFGIIYSAIKRKKVPIYLIIFAISTIAGAVFMFQTPIYKTSIAVEEDYKMIKINSIEELLENAKKQLPLIMQYAIKNQIIAILLFVYIVIKMYANNMYISVTNPFLRNKEIKYNIWNKKEKEKEEEEKTEKERDKSKEKEKKEIKIDARLVNENALKYTKTGDLEINKDNREKSQNKEKEEQEEKQELKKFKKNKIKDYIIPVNIILTIILIFNIFFLIYAGMAHYKQIFVTKELNSAFYEFNINDAKKQTILNISFYVLNLIAIFFIKSDKTRKKSIFMFLSIGLISGMFLAITTFSARCFYIVHIFFVLTFMFMLRNIDDDRESKIINSENINYTKKIDILNIISTSIITMAAVSLIFYWTSVYKPIYEAVVKRENHLRASAEQHHKEYKKQMRDARRVGKIYNTVEGPTIFVEPIKNIELVFSGEYYIYEGINGSYNLSYFGYLGVPRLKVKVRGK